MFKERFRLISFILLASLLVHADDVHIAVSSNFNGPMDQISNAFTKESGHKVILSYGSTGKLFAQIKNDAPFDVFLSADQKHPQHLISEKFAVSKSQFTYAIGRIVLWSAKEQFVDPQGNVLKSKSFQHVALADPKLAPYGAAAKEVLKKLKLWTALQRKIVYGENIAQTYQFVVTENADLGFIAYSQLKGPNSEKRGSYWMIPQDLYSPIKQDAILVNKGKNNKAAKQFLDFLKGKTAQSIISDYGYDIEKGAL